MYAYPNASVKSVTDFTITTPVTPYGLITLMNEYGQDKYGQDYKVLPTQMGYTYLKKGYIDGIKRTSTSGVKINPDNATAWVNKYFQKYSK
jgi:hypothetical protein